MAELVGSAEIAKRLGIARQSVHQLQKRHPEFPAPVTRLEQAQVWAWPDVEAWAKATGRL